MKRYPITLISRAQELRSQGFTYSEICNSLGEVVPKSTLNGWVKNISLPSFYQEKVSKLGHDNILAIRKLALIKKREIIQKRLDDLRIKNSSLVNYVNRSVAVLLLSTLYWCEGAKYPSHTGIRFGSSDPEMIRLFITLLRCCYPLNENKFRLTIQCRADQNTQELMIFWQDITQIPPSLTYKTQIDKRSIGIPTKHHAYKGVCVIEYINTNLQCELQFLGKSLGTEELIAIMKNQIK